MVLLASRGLSENLQKEFVHEPILSPLLTSADPDFVNDQYELYFWNALGVDTVKGSSLGKTLINIMMLSPERLLVGGMISSLSTIEDSLFNFLRHYSPSDTFNDKMGFRMNLDDFLNEAMRLELRQSQWLPTTVNQLLPDELLERVLKRIESQPHWSEDENKYWFQAKLDLFSTIKSAAVHKVKLINSFKKLRQNPVPLLEEFVLAFVGTLAKSRERSFKLYRTIIVNLLSLVAIEGKEEALVRLGNLFADDFWLLPRTNADVFRRATLEIVRNLSGLVSPLFDGKDMSLLNAARDLFFRFYDKEVMPPMTKELKTFMTGYLRNVKRFLVDMFGKAELKVHQKVLIIDLLYASREIPNFISGHQFKFFLQNIELLATNFSQELFEALGQTKIFFSLGDSLMHRNFELFYELYEASIMMVAFFDTNKELRKGQIWYKWTTYIENGLEDLNRKKTKGVGMFGKKPPQKRENFYAKTIPQNYFFYKAVLLLATLDKATFSSYYIADFFFSDNFLIHKFMIEPQVKAVFKPIQRTMRPNKGYNYRVFSGTEIPSGLLATLQKQQKARRAYISKNKLDRLDD